jgi:ribose transport system substrate-binding protein
MVKKVLLASFFVLCVLRLQPAIAAPTEEYVVVGALLGIPFWEDPIAGMNAAAKELGVKVTFVGPMDWNAAAQVSQLQQVLVRKPSGIVILPVDPNSVRAIFKDAIAKHIPIVCADTDAPDTDRLCFLGTDRYSAGSTAADFMIEKLGTSGKIGVVTLGGSLALDTSLKGFKEKLQEKAPGIKIVAYVDSKGEPIAIENGVNSMIQGYPDLSGIFANGTQESSSVVSAVKKAGKAGKLVVVGQGATLRSLDIMQAVKDGVMTASITQRSFQQFYYAIKMLYDLNHLTNCDLGLSWAKTGINPLPRYVDSGTMIITPENVNSFYSQIAK